MGFRFVLFIRKSVSYSRKEEAGGVKGDSASVPACLLYLLPFHPFPFLSWGKSGYFCQCSGRDQGEDQACLTVHSVIGMGPGSSCYTLSMLAEPPYSLGNLATDQ